MNMDRYWKVIREQWVLFLLGAVLTTAFAFMYTRSQPDTYEACGTFVVRPRTVDDGSDDPVRAIDTLNRSVEIGSTYAFVARSAQIEDRARSTLDDLPSGLSVGAHTVAGTNVIEICSAGQDPIAARDLAVAVGDETVEYISQLQDAFELAPLDTATLPSSPSGPNRKLNLVLGTMFGVMVGACMALLGHLVKEWRGRPDEAVLRDPELPRADEAAAEAPAPSTGIEYDHQPVGAIVGDGSDATTDDPQTGIHYDEPLANVYADAPSEGVYSERYFNDRFRHEVVEAERRRKTFSLGLLRVVTEHGSVVEDGVIDVVPTESTLRRVAFVLQGALADDDVLAYLGDGVFAMILPNCDEAHAERKLKHWQREIEAGAYATPGDPASLRVSVDVGTYGHNRDTSLPEVPEGSSPRMMVASDAPAN